MALWQQQSGKLYLPPAKPVAHVLNTDDYVVGTNLFFHAGSERLLTVGHPYFEIQNPAVPGQVFVPKVSGSQFRVFRLLLPDPNRFALVDKSYYNSEHERLVWKLRGIQIGRGGPLGLGTTGHPLFNKLGDTENPSVYPPKPASDNRMNVSVDPKQVQMFVIGCEPAVGEHWDIAKPCDDERLNNGDCPPIQLLNTVIQDGDMCDIGFGAANFKTLQQDMSSVPLDIVDQICKYPDIIKMEQDIYGDKLFFFTKREQAYARHYFARSGTMGDSIPDKDFYIPPNRATQDLPQNNLGSHVYFPTASGSLVSSDTQLFNRPYWLQKAQGPNNGICWNNQLFVTVVDNSRNTNLTISVYSKADKIPQSYVYNADDFKQYLRHTEEYDFELIFQLCKVPLEPDILAHLNVMNPLILENWQLSFVPPPPQSIEDTYRFIRSLATRCPPADDEVENKDPFKEFTFWSVDLTEKFSTELAQFPLGRKFLFQTGNLSRNVSLKRSRTTTSSTKRAKRRKTKQ